MSLDTIKANQPISKQMLVAEVGRLDKRIDKVVAASEDRMSVKLVAMETRLVRRMDEQNESVLTVIAMANHETTDRFERLESRSETTEGQIGVVSLLQQEINVRLIGLEVRTEKIEDRLTTVESRLDKVELRLDKIENRLDVIEARLDKIESRLDKIEQRLDRLEDRMDGVEERLSVVEIKLDTLTDLVKQILVKLS